MTDQANRTRDTRFLRALRDERLLYLLATGGLLVAIELLDSAKLPVVTAVVWSSLARVIFTILSVMVFVGLVNAWVKGDAIVRHLGKESGFRSLIIASLIGTLITGPLFAVYPLVKSLHDKGARTAVVAVILTSWGGIRLPLLPLEVSFLGMKFTVLRNLLVTAMSIPVGLAVEKGVELLQPRETEAR